MAPLNDKKIEKLQKILELANEDYATPDDLVKAMEAILGIINSERERLTALIGLKSAQGEELNAKTLEYLNTKEKGLKTLISELAQQYQNSDDELLSTVSKEIKRLEKKIPSRTDLSSLESQVAAIQADLITVPTEITANPEAVRDALELLPEGDKLAIEAIEDLRAILDDLQRRPHGSTGAAGPRFLRYLGDVAIDSITNGQGIAWNATLGRFEPVTLGGGGAGSTYETPTGAVDGANVMYTVSAAPKCIIYYGTTLFEGANGYSRSGLTITMPYAPTVSDQFKAVI